MSSLISRLPSDYYRCLELTFLASCSRRPENLGVNPLSRLVLLLILKGTLGAFSCLHCLFVCVLHKTQEVLANTSSLTFFCFVFYRNE